jgi:hypothetical protein
MSAKKPLRDTTQDSNTMKRSFQLAVEELEAVLSRKKPITDLTKVAANTVSNYAKIRSTEIHDKGLEILMMRKDIKVLDFKDD